MQIRELLCLLLAASLAACSSVVARTARNEPLCPGETVAAKAIYPSRLKSQMGCYMPGRPDTFTASALQQNVPRARQSFEANDTDRPDVFVGLAISGGGSRAAVFGMAVMKELNDIGILPHVSAISTTSGGGLAGAYYALHSQNMDWNEAQDVMARDYLGMWLRSNVGLRHVMKVVATDEDRSDLMADVFDAEIFGGKTYADLGAFAPGSAPIWLANATQIGDARRFTFSELEFASLGSSLATFPIAQAVMASAAFPAVFNSVTLRDFTPARIVDGEVTVPAAVRYRHLIDGGPTDNLGIEALLELARSHDYAKWGPLGARDRGSRQGTCLLIIADAYPRGVPSRYDLKQDLRGAFGRLVDPNFFDALDALLMSRREDLLSYLGLEDSDAFGHRKAHQFVYFDAPNFSSRLGQANRVEAPDHLYPPGSDPRPPGTIANSVPIREGTFRCAAWHLNLSGLTAIQTFAQPDGTSTPQPAPPEEALDEHRHFHQALVAQTATNFRLTGPEGCPADLLGEALRESAHVLVREDWQSQHAACDWLRSNGLDVADECGQFMPPTSMRRIPLVGRVVPVGLGTPGGPPDETVRCLAPNESR